MARRFCRSSKQVRKTLARHRTTDEWGGAQEASALRARDGDGQRSAEWLDDHRKQVWQLAKAVPTLAVRKQLTPGG